LDLGFIFKMLGCAISDSLYIGFGEMISILNAKWAYDVSGWSAVGTSVKGCVNRKKSAIFQGYTSVLYLNW